MVEVHTRLLNDVYSTDNTKSFDNLIYFQPNQLALRPSTSASKFAPRKQSIK